MENNMYITTLAVSAALAFIPANIAKKKGYSFGLWWFYGWVLWIVAIIHVNCIPDKNASKQTGTPQTYTPQTSAPQTYAPQTSAPQAAYPTAAAAIDPVEELKKYKKLYDQGVLTEQEFNRKKQQMLDRI